MSAIMVSQVHITNAPLFDEYMSKTQKLTPTMMQTLGSIESKGH